MQFRKDAYLELFKAHGGKREIRHQEHVVGVAAAKIINACAYETTLNAVGEKNTAGKGQRDRRPQVDLGEQVGAREHAS